MLAEAPDAEQVFLTADWRVVHATRCALAGWLVVLPRRHTTAISEHTAAEAQQLGRLLVAVSAAIEEHTGCSKTYVAQFAEAAGFEHTHFHVIPRSADLPPDLVGPRIFDYLARPEAEQLSLHERNEHARALRPLITARMS